MATDYAALERERTKRQFIQTLGAAFGVEQSFAETDAMPGNMPGRYEVYGQQYGYAAEGQPVSQAQGGASAVPLLLLVVAGLVLWKLAR